MSQPATEPSPRAESRRGLSIGAILVDQGKLKPEDINAIQCFASEQGLWFGDAAVQLNLLSPQDVELALARQYNYTVLTRGPGGVHDDVVAAYDPQNEVVEEFRALRSQIMFRWHAGTSRKVLAITSPDRGEGRSRLVANLAVTFAQIGERTLLVDADMRNPRQHELFNLDNTLGLSALLTGRAGSSTVHRVHPNLRLFVVSAGNTPPNPQELLARPTFDLLLQRWSTQYDLVLIDTPAAAETSDAQLIAARAGSALVMARNGVTRHARLASTLQNFKIAGVDVVGCVLNEH